MELIDQHSKRIMEGCKERAQDAGLRFKQETLEYLVTNRDLLELSPKMMIPTLYDYWVHDVEVLKGKGRYDLYPSNPFETVINTQPAISFYNDNNPDWLNVMIFYHVLAHIDFFQNNIYFQNTWDYDFNGEALADKRLIARLRSEHGRWVDYVIEFARGIDNLVGYHQELSRLDTTWHHPPRSKLDYYFDVFLQSEVQEDGQLYFTEIERYNASCREHRENGERIFFLDIQKQYPEFEEKFKKHLRNSSREQRQDLLQFLVSSSEFLNKKNKAWMKSVLEVVRKTSVFFQPQIRTKMMNEGWATYWHEKLFLEDNRIRGHEVDFSRIHSQVASLSRVGLNPYALGLRLFQEIEELADKGRYSLEFQRLLTLEERKQFDTRAQQGKDFVFQARKNLCDLLFIKHFLTQDFVDRHKLFVAGKRLNKGKRSWEYFVKSRNVEDYRAMLLNSLYHPPSISFAEQENKTLYLNHRFENKPLVKEFISNTMLGLEYLWGGPVQLETSEVASINRSSKEQQPAPDIKWRRVLYTMKNRELSKQSL